MLQVTFKVVEYANGTVMQQNISVMQKNCLDTFFGAVLKKPPVILVIIYINIFKQCRNIIKIAKLTIYSKEVRRTLETLTKKLTFVPGESKFHCCKRDPKSSVSPFERFKFRTRSLWYSCVITRGIPLLWQRLKSAPELSEHVEDLSLNIEWLAGGTGRVNLQNLEMVCVLDILSDFMAVTMYIGKAQITICNMILLFSPSHRYGNLKKTFFSSKPSAPAVHTAKMWSPTFMLINVTITYKLWNEQIWTPFWFISADAVCSV